MKRILLSVAALCAWAAPGGAAEAPVIGEGPYVIAFCAHDEGVGHAFVMTGKTGAKGALVGGQTYGFFPADFDKTTISKSAFTKVQSILLKEKGANLGAKECMLVVRVKEEQWKKAQAVIEAWGKKKKDYKLGASDCTTFVADVAESIGLKAPKRTIPAVGADTAAYPFSFVKGLVEKNPAKK